MRIKNTTAIPSETIRLIIDFVRPSGISNFDVMVKNGTSLAGRAYTRGSGYHDTANAFIVCRLPSDESYMKEWGKKRYPAKLRTYQIGQLKGRRYYLANRIEAAVYLIAHELRHLWQAKAKNKAGYFWGSRGKFREIDTESYAIQMLRKWRNK